MNGGSPAQHVSLSLLSLPSLHLVLDVELRHGDVEDVLELGKPQVERRARTESSHDRVGEEADHLRSIKETRGQIEA